MKNNDKKRKKDLTWLFWYINEKYGNYQRKKEKPERRKKELSNKSIKIPNFAILDVTMVCNLNCPMCCVKDRLNVKTDKSLALEEIKIVINNLKDHHVERVMLLGGEPFTRHDLVDIIDYITRKQIKVIVVTNATLIDDRIIEKLKKYKDNLSFKVSLDGIKNTHDLIRGKGSYDKLIDTVKKLKNDFVVYFNTTLMKINLSEVDELIALTYSLDIEGIDLYFEMNYTQEEINKSEQMLKTKICQNISDKKFEYPYEDFLEIFKKIKGREKVEIHPSILKNTDNHRRFYHSDYGPVKLSCNVSDAICINQTGNVRMCYFSDLYAGNLLEQPLSKIWNSERFRNYRRDLIASNMTPACNKCCMLDCVN